MRVTRCIALKREDDGKRREAAGQVGDQLVTLRRQLAALGVASIRLAGGSRDAAATCVCSRQSVDQPGWSFVCKGPGQCRRQLLHLLLSIVNNCDPR